MGRRGVALLWLSLAALLGLAFILDEPVRERVHAHAGPGWIEVARLISRFGAWQWLMALLAAVAAIAWLKADRATVRLAVTMMAVASLAGLCADALRATIGRTRPNASAAAGWYGPAHFGEAQYAAFPSGHVAAATGLIGPLLILRRRMGAVAIALPVVIAAARIIVGAHHLSDTVAGACLGVLITRAWWRWTGK